MGELVAKGVCTVVGGEGCFLGGGCAVGKGWVLRWRQRWRLLGGGCAVGKGCRRWVL